VSDLFWLLWSVLYEIAGLPLPQRKDVLMEDAWLLGPMSWFREEALEKAVATRTICAHRALTAVITARDTGVLADLMQSDEELL
jgi:hypothetical protein